MNSFRHRVFLASFACLLAACGQRGPLYLPQEPAQISVPGAPTVPETPTAPQRVTPAVEPTPAPPAAPYIVPTPIK